MTLQMSHTSPLRIGLMAAGALAAFAAPAIAQDAATTMDKGDTTFMLVSTILVLLMILPGLALFYGGLVRTKNMLSVLLQCTLITAMVMVIWVLYGYSFAFGGSESAFWGGTAKMFLAGVTPASEAATFSDGVMIPEYIFIAFQMTFACITPALIVGAFAERIRFSAVMLFVALWVTFVYFPVAHMVWDANGLLYKMGALDFAGGTVVHINAGIAGLIGAIMVGKRTGFGRDMMAPHSMTLTMVGAALLWFGWFGFNAGSNLEANAGRSARHDQHFHRNRRRHPGLDGDRNPASRKGLAARRRLRHDRRPRRRHPGGGLCGSGRGHRAGRGLLGGLLLFRRGGEEQVRL
jgi:Amt family ammonium transporter